MRTLESRGYGRTRSASSVHNVLPVVMLRVIQQSLNSRLRERPGARIQRLLLAPNDRLCIRVAVEVLFQLRPWEWVELLDTGDGGVGQVVLLAVFEESGEDLAGAEDDAVDLVVRVELEFGVFFVGGVRDDPLEVTVASEVLDWRASQWVTQQALAEERDQRLAELSVHLPTEDVERVGWGSADTYLHVAILVLAVKPLWRWEDTRVFVAEL